MALAVVAVLMAFLPAAPVTALHLGQGLVPTANAACVPDPVVCPSGIYFGASLQGLPRAVGALDKFGALIGKQPTVADYFAAFGDQLDAVGMSGLVADHRLPMVTWSPAIYRSTGNPFSLSDIASGRFDPYLRSQAIRLASVPGRVAVRFAHEMNGGWFPWGRGVNNNRDADYVAAFRHVHDVVTAAGATNVIWVWAPSVKSGPVDLAGLYPGDAYVDWVGLSAYFDRPTDTFAALVRPTLSDIDTFAGTKPLVVAEAGVLPGPRRPGQITDLVGGLLSTPRMVGLTWFEQVGRYDWRVSGDSLSAAALAAALATPWVVSAGSTYVDGAPPMNQRPAAVSGVPAVGADLSANPGQWRSWGGAGGATTVSARWYRCPDETTTSTCTPASEVDASSYRVVPADWGQRLRLRETGTNGHGVSDAWSAPTGTVVAQPAPPLALTVTSSATALRVTLPPAGFAVTHWLLTVDALTYHPIPVGTATYWATGLTAGTTHSVTLAAADITASDKMVSTSLRSTVSTMSGPSTPFVEATGQSATFTLPRVAPVGSRAWVLTFDGIAHVLPLAAATWTPGQLEPGKRYNWAFAPASGVGPDGGFGGLGASTSGRIVPVGTPDDPKVVPVGGGASFYFSTLPTGATGWVLTVGPRTFPMVTTSSFTATGFASGYRATWTLRAVNGGSRSMSVSGTFVPG